MIVGFYLAFYDLFGTGYAQQGFTSVCPRDKFVFKKENLAVARFLDDLTSNHLIIPGDLTKYMAYVQVIFIEHHI